MLPKSRVSSFRKRHHTRKEFENRERRKDANEKKNKLIHVPLTLHRLHPSPSSQKDYVCFEFVPRHHNIIRFRKGREMIKEEFSTVCSYVQFQSGREWNYDLMLGGYRAGIGMPSFSLTLSQSFFFVFVISIIYVFFIIVYIQRLLYDLKN